MIEISQEEKDLIKALPITAEGQGFDINDYIDFDALKQSEYSPSTRFQQEYFSLPYMVMKNIELNTRMKSEMISMMDNTETANELEDYRLFPRDFMKEKGVFYCQNISDVVQTYDYMRQSDIFQIDNDTYQRRYMLPICLPNGDVYTHMGYCPPIIDETAHKYEMGSVKGWINQGNIVGNMESLSKYPTATVIYVAEGMMDAYRLESVFECPSLAILGSKLTASKRSILYNLKARGYSLIYVPDNDSAGLNDQLLGNSLFDNIMYITPPTELHNQEVVIKDFDVLAKEIYVLYILEHASEINPNIDPEDITVAMLSPDMISMLNNEIKSHTKLLRNQTLLPTYSTFYFNQIMSSFCSSSEAQI